MKTKPSYGGYIFDLDGTLFDLPVDWREVRRGILDLAGGTMKRVPIIPLVKSMTASDQALKDRIFALIDSYELPAVASTLPIDGAVEVVRRASEVGAALVTMQGRRACTGVLGRFGVRECFRAILTREDSLERYEQLMGAADALGVSPRKVLFCGDKRDDLLSGRRAGMDVALVGRKGKARWKPDYLLHDVGGLRPLLSRRA